MAQGAYRARLLALSTLEELQQELSHLGADRGGIPIMAAKGVLRLVRVDQIPTPAANIIKQEILARGGDLATPRSAAAFAEPKVDVIFIGNLTTLRSTISKLYRQRVYDLPAIADAVQQVLIHTTPGYLPVARHHHPPAAEEMLDDLAGGRIPTEPGAARRATGRPTLTPVEGRQWQLGTRTYVAVMLSPAGTEARGRANLSPTAAEADVLIIDADGSSPSAPAAVAAAVRRLRECCPDVPLGVQTGRWNVVEAALSAGATMVRPARGCDAGEVIRATAGSTALVVIPHHTPEPVNGDVLGHMVAYFCDAVSAATARGLQEEQIILDAGLGSGKTAEQNRTVLRRLRELTSLGRPLLVEPWQMSVPTVGTSHADCTASVCALVPLAVAGGADFVVIPDKSDLMAAVRSADWLIRH